jgi:hypothetical protein
MLDETLALLNAAWALAPSRLAARQTLATSFVVGSVAGYRAGVLANARAGRHTTDWVAFASSIVDVARLVQDRDTVRRLGQL